MGVSNNLARHEKSNWFTTTHWTVVVSAKSEDESQALEALDGLCRTYWAPVHAFVRSHGRSPEDADDLTQQFFARFLEKEHYKLACPERGRFRSFLLTSVRRFLVNEWERASAQKRGGSAQPVSLNETHTETDGPRFEPIEERTAADVYDQCWIISLLGQVRERLAAEYSADGQPERFARLEQFLPGEQNDLTYAQAAALLGVAEGTLKSDVHRFKRRYRDLLRQEIAHTVSTPEEIDNELRHLLAVLGRMPC